MSSAPRSVLVALAFSASVAFAQTPAFTVVNHGLDATFGNVGKRIFDPQVAGLTGVAFGSGLFVAIGASGNEETLRWLTSPAVGPTLAVFGVGGTLADPKLEIYSGATKTIENDNWAGTAELKAAFSSVAAFAFSGDISRDAALVATLQPGSYTAQISGVGNTTGVALVEIYELP